MGAAPHTAARTPLQALSALETFRSEIAAHAGRALPFVVSPLTTVSRPRRWPCWGSQEPHPPCEPSPMLTPHRTREQPRIDLCNVTLTCPDGEDHVGYAAVVVFSSTAGFGPTGNTTQW
ncbi:hypothetical protein GCM10022230_13220 [Pseudoclavibacter caeni]